MSVKDYNDPERRRFIIEEAVGNWQRLSEYGKNEGLQFLMFEPMSIPREMAETIDKAKELWEQVNEKSSIDVMLCLDVGHGSVNSGDRRDSDPYIWLKELAHISPVIHICQTDSVENIRHWPFTDEYNRIGIIDPVKVLEAIEISRAKDIVLVLEITHPERCPAEEKVLDDIKYSVEYWRRYVEE
jgi:sugar phosphate isomerase/epimerase